MVGKGLTHAGPLLAFGLPALIERQDAGASEGKKGGELRTYEAPRRHPCGPRNKGMGVRGAGGEKVESILKALQPSPY